MSDLERATLLADFLRDHPQATFASWHESQGHLSIDAHYPERLQIYRNSLPKNWSAIPINWTPGPTLHDLRDPNPCPYATNPNQQCQNEPIQLGTQIQPQGASWVGTAGAPVQWKDANGKAHYGILSNWHVLVLTPRKMGTTQHQPLADRPACAVLTDAEQPSPDKTNLIDAAIADALINGKHTIDRRILGIGTLAQAYHDAKPGETMRKAGRTTQLTLAGCQAVGAAARVDYGFFTAIFADQDIYENPDNPFSAPGDSGSLIVTGDPPQATSLLFAGGGDITIGCAIRHVVDRFKLTFGF